MRSRSSTNARCTPELGRAELGCLGVRRERSIPPPHDRSFMDALFVSWDRDARQRAHGSSGRRPARKAAAGDRIGALVTTRGSLATIAAALLILVAGVALLYALRAQLPPTIVSSTPSPTPTATAATATTTPPDAIASNVVNVCGPLNPYQGASG